jgi:hypothetical protein
MKSAVGAKQSKSEGSGCAAAKEKLRRYWGEHGSQGTGSDASELLSLFVDYTPCITGLEATRMSEYKLHRAENLRFVNADKIASSIVRHGAAAFGSIYGEIQHWEIDLSSDTASRFEGGQRRISPRRLRSTRHTPRAQPRRFSEN